MDAHQNVYRTLLEFGGVDRDNAYLMLQMRSDRMLSHDDILEIVDADEVVRAHANEFLFHAVARLDGDMIRDLTKKYGADINGKNALGESVVHYALRVHRPALGMDAPIPANMLMAYGFDFDTTNSAGETAAEALGWMEPEKVNRFLVGANLGLLCKRKIMRMLNVTRKKSTI